MTIALGVLATDGVVIAADTQVSIPGYFKLGQGKISGAIKRTYRMRQRNYRVDRDGGLD